MVIALPRLHADQLSNARKKGTVKIFFTSSFSVVSAAALDTSSLRAAQVEGGKTAGKTVEFSRNGCKAKLQTW